MVEMVPQIASSALSQIITKNTVSDGCSTVVIRNTNAWRDWVGDNPHNDNDC